MTLAPVSASTALVPSGPSATKSLATASAKSMATALSSARSSTMWTFLGHKLAELTQAARLSSRQRLMAAVASGSVAETRELLATGVDVTFSSPAHGGQTPLHMAASRGDVAILTLLLDAGAPVNVVADSGATPLFVACSQGHAGVVRLLLQYKARVDLPVARATGGFQAIHAVAQLTHATPATAAALLTLLLRHGARVDAVSTPRRLTPLMLACRAGADAVVELLLDRGADPDAEDRDGHTPLHFACSEAQYRATYLLLTAGADPGIPDASGETPFDVARRGGDARIAHLLDTNGVGAAPFEPQAEGHAHGAGPMSVGDVLAQDQQLRAALARHGPELAEVLVKNRVKYAALCELGCIGEEEEVCPEDDWEDPSVPL